eukprot:17430_1
MDLQLWCLWHARMGFTLDSTQFPLDICGLGIHLLEYKLSLARNLPWQSNKLIRRPWHSNPESAGRIYLDYRAIESHGQSLSGLYHFWFSYCGCVLGAAEVRKDFQKANHVQSHPERMGRSQHKTAVRRGCSVVHNTFQLQETACLVDGLQQPGLVDWRDMDSAVVGAVLAVAVVELVGPVPRQPLHQDGRGFCAVCWMKNP